MYKEIVSEKLGRFVFSLDDEDERRVDQYRWYITRNRQIIAVVNGVLTSLPRFLLSYTGEMFIDHIDGNPLNNSKSNFRLSSPMQNLWNRKKFTTYNQQLTTSQYKGVTYDWRVYRWKAQIGFEGGVIYLGHFDSELEAAMAYNNTAQYCFQEFARINPIPACPVDTLLVPMTFENLLRLIQIDNHHEYKPEIVDLYLDCNPMLPEVDFPDSHNLLDRKKADLLLLILSNRYLQTPPNWVNVKLIHNVENPALILHYAKKE